MKSKRWLYHSTFADHVEGISSLGLVPSTEPHWGGLLADWSMGKVFFTPRCPLAAHYAKTLFAKVLWDFGLAPDPMLLRIQPELLPDAARDPESVSGDVYVERTVPPADLEIWTPWLRRWKPVSWAGDKFTEMWTIRDEPGELDVPAAAAPGEYAEAYIEQVWPSCG